MDTMDAALVDGKVPVKGTRVGNLFVHYRLGIDYVNPGYKTIQVRDFFIIAHYKSGCRIDNALGHLPKLKAEVIALAKKINAAIPEFENDEAWMLAHQEEVGAKLKAFRRPERSAT